MIVFSIERTLRGLVVLSSVPCLFAQGGGSPQQRVIEMLQRGDSAAAAGAIEQQLKATPKDAALWNLLGISRAELHQTALARAAFQRGLSLAPADAGLLENLGLLYFNEQDYTSAERILSQAVAAGSTKPGVEFSYAASLLRTDKQIQGLSLLKKLEPTLADSAEYWCERGWAEIRSDAKAADASFDRALKLAPSDVRTLNGAASAAEQLSDEERALAFLIRARKAAPDDVRTLLHFGSVCLRRDLSVDAINALDRAYGLAPHNNLALFLLARAQIAFQQWQKSYELFLEFDKRVPNYAPAQYVLGWLHLKMNEPEQARQRFERVLQLDPAHIEARYELGALMLEAGDDAAGEAEIARVLDQAPGHIRANVSYGDLLARRGQLEAARTRYERAIASDASYGPAHYRLSLVLQRAGILELAEHERGLGAELNEKAEKASKTVMVLTEPDGRMLAGAPGSVKGLER